MESKELIKEDLNLDRAISKLIVHHLNTSPNTIIASQKLGISNRNIFNLIRKYNIIKQVRLLKQEALSATIYFIKE